jgi:hypothetical protein
VARGDLGDDDDDNYDGDDGDDDYDGDEGDDDYDVYLYK